MNVLALFASTAAILMAPAPQSGSELVQVSVNEPFMYHGLRYTVLSAKDGVKSYTQRYDQRQSKLSPGFTTECLTVVDLVVENPTQEAQSFSALIPALTYGDGSTTDRSQWDVEQRSMVRTTNDLHINTQDLFSYTLDPVAVGPNGKAHFALAFSHPVRSKATKVSFQPGVTFISGGVLITHPTTGPTITISLG